MKQREGEFKTSSIRRKFRLRTGTVQVRLRALKATVKVRVSQNVARDHNVLNKSSRARPGTRGPPAEKIYMKKMIQNVIYIYCT